MTLLSADVPKIERSGPTLSFTGTTFKPFSEEAELDETELTCPKKYYK